MKTDRYFLRQKLVTYARAFGCSRNTVRKWFRRYRPSTPHSLLSQSTHPHRCPHKVSHAVEGLVVRLRRQNGFGAERLKREFQIPCGVSAIRRILRSHGLVRLRKRKHQTKRCLRAVKAPWRLFELLVADTKYLQDIPAYWPQMRRLELSQFQYTACEPLSGLCLPGYADELSKPSSTRPRCCVRQSYAVWLAEQVSAHVAERCGDGASVGGG